METKIHLLCQGEENIELSCDGSSSSATNLPSKNIDSKKYITFSKMIEKRFSPQFRCWKPEHKKMYETSILLCEDEKSSAISGGKIVRRRKNLQVQLHTKRPEIAPSMKPSKQKMAMKEHSSCKLLNQYTVHKTLSPHCTSSSLTRRNEVLYNLSQTLYEEVPIGHFSSEELSALQKACKIFSKIRRGKIYVNDLPMILHILKISLSDSEMRKALTTTDVDVNGILPFTDFLKAVNDVSYLVSQDPAFQNALKIFHRIKGGRVAVDEVATVLDSMAIPVIPEILQEVLAHASIDRNFTVDIGDIIFTLDELQQQYEAVSIMEGSTLDETTLDKKLSNVLGSHGKYKRRDTFSSKSSQLLSQRFSGNDLQYHKIMEKNDLEFKDSKRTVQTRKYLDGVDSSDIRFQEPHSKEGVNFKRSVEKAEIHGSKSKPQNLKSISRLKKSLDKSDTINIPKLQEPSERSHSSLPKQGTFKEKTTVNALENVLEAISKLQEDYIAAEELQSILPSIGITLSDKEFQKIVTNTDRNEDGMMKLDDFLSALSKEQSLPEHDVVKNVIKAIDKIKNENVDFEDLNTSLQNLGIYLSKPEFEKTMELIKVDEMNKVNFKEFVDTVMNNIEHVPEKLLLSDTVENLRNLSQETISAPDLWNSLSSLNRNLKKDEFLAALKLSTIDGDKVQTDEFAKVVKNMCDASRLEELKEVVSALDLLEGDMIAGRNLEDFLRNIGIKSPSEEAEKILQSDFVSEDGMINVKDCVKALTDTQTFSNFIALNEAMKALDCIKESNQSDKDQYLDVQKNTSRINSIDHVPQEILDDSSIQDFRKKAISSNLKLPKADDFREAACILSHVDNGKIGIPNLEHALKTLNVNLAEEDFREALKYCDINDNNEVDLKDFLSGIKENPQIKDSQATQLLLSTTQVFQNDLIDIPALKTLLMNSDLHAANTLLNEVLRHVPEHG
ncbi:EF-hand calcium-binding domain-containing protein 13 isoform X2 [Talpa occidentalis]|uniref:EF-hand calcium-binding domain-containing protein 13 isoform X2 n=1 Tax=Talpa occidentalis TaxID=50954 RepID=UPI00188E9A78|nr:EF-hand calcium-binding domain-containing protein 13 isoform X2 [Talpa occidentalis]